MISGILKLNFYFKVLKKNIDSMVDIFLILIKSIISYCGDYLLTRKPFS